MMNKIFTTAWIGRGQVWRSRGRRAVNRRGRHGGFVHCARVNGGGTAVAYRTQFIANGTVTIFIWLIESKSEIVAGTQTGGDGLKNYSRPVTFTTGKSGGAKAVAEDIHPNRWWVFGVELM